MMLRLHGHGEDPCWRGYLICLDSRSGDRSIQGRTSSTVIRLWPELLLLRQRALLVFTQREPGASAMKPGQAATFGKSAAQFLVDCVRQAVAAKPRAEPDDGQLEAVKQWQQVFEHNPVMYFMVDPAGTVINVNTFGAAQLG